MSEENNKVELEGVMDEGYGLIPKKVMKDPELTIEAKAIYSFIASYSGAGKTKEAFPSVDWICSKLGISRNRFYKHRKLLVDKDYIRIRQQKKDTEWANNIYTLTSVPRIRFRDTQNEDAQNGYTQNEYTISNSSINNSINNNKSKSSPEKVKEKQKKIKRSYGEFKNVKLTDEEVNKLKDRFPESYEGKINDLSFYIESKGAKYKSHYATILTWDRKDKENESVKFSPSNEKEKYGWKDQLPI